MRADRPLELVQLSGGSAAPGLAPLSGSTVAVASDRRQHPIAAEVERFGARAVSVQAARTVAQPVPAELAAAVRHAAAAPADEVIVSSAFGLRTWLAAARAAGLAEELLTTLRAARLLARDPRTADGLRELGFSQIWSTASGTTEDLFAHLIAQPMSGRRVVVQLDAEPLRELTQALRDLGADVVEVRTYQMRPPSHRDGLRRLVDQIIRRQWDALVLLSESITGHLLEQSTVDGKRDALLNAVAEDVFVVCLGPRSARPLLDRGVTPAQPRRPYPAEVVATLVDEVPRRALRVTFGEHDVQLRGQALMVKGKLIPLQPGPAAVLRALACEPGRVLSAAELRSRIPGWSDVDDHAIEMAVSRLRRSLDGTALQGVALVQTVIKRGYRLAH